MATMNFSLPDELKARFDARFAGRNKSAVLAACLEAALAEEELKAQRREAFASLQRLRDTLPRVNGEELAQLRDELRAQSDAAHIPAGVGSR